MELVESAGANDWARVSTTRSSCGIVSVAAAAPINQTTTTKMA
jgi:hypothetical protein